MARLAGQLVLSIVVMALVMAGLLFFPAATWRFWQAWLFLGVFFVLTVLISVYFLVRSPALLTRRMRWNEPERQQRIWHNLVGLLFFGGLVVAGFDHRYSWSHIPTTLVLIGDIAIAVGFLFVFFVFRANPYAASTVEVEPRQQVIASGPYTLVRHPMYLGAIPILLGMPFALGSAWALFAYVPIIPSMVFRLLHEEQLLRRELPGYTAYTERVHWRLIPGVW